MSSEYPKSESQKGKPLIAIADKVIWTLQKRVEGIFYSKKVDKKSNGHIVKKQLRCAISSCFDKYNICCKVCDIKKCRYKCNFIEKEICEHQKSD